MDDQPRNLRDHIFNISAFWDLLFTGTLMGGLAYGNFLLFASRNGIAASDLQNSGKYFSAVTLTYVTIVFCQLVNILVRRSRDFTISRYMFTNKQLWMAMGLSVVCVLSITYIPALHLVFGSGALLISDWMYVFIAAGIFFVVKESMKIFSLFKNRHVQAK